jgi:large subunit ribosomal protein L18
MRKQIKKIKNSSKAKEQRRKLSIRKKIIGTTVRPRICATKTNANIFVQVIDDSANKTLFSVQTFGKAAVGSNSNAESAKLIGAAVAKGLKEKNLETAVFDRNGRKFTGVISTLASSIREAGIQI